MKSFNQELKKLEYLYGDTPNILIALFLLFSILFYAFYNIVDTENLLVWYFLNILALTLRLVIFRQYKKNIITKDNFQQFYWKFFITMAFGAMMLGMGAFLIFPSNIEYQVIFIILLAGLTSGTLVNLAAYKQMFYTYLFFTITPLSYVMYFQGSEGSKTIVFFIFLYVATLVTLSRKVSYAITHNILLAEELKEKVIEANSANKAKSEFLSVMSHEIRTPLNAIMGFVQILQKKEDDVTKKKYLDTINASSKVLTNVINDILDISKIESGSFFLESVEFETQEEFKTLFSLFEQSASEKKINLINSIDVNIPKYLESDILRLKQIISNLLSNAIKFTSEGNSVELIIDFHLQSKMLYVEVRDEGIGIAPQNIELVTEAFTQADSTTARKYGGSGLGLSIVTKLLKLFGTKLEIQSELGKGSRFSFALKVKSVEHKEKAKEEHQNTSFKRKRVLVAEDNKTNQMLIKILLQELGLEVVIAQDGQMAVEKYRQERYNIVFMDINMPNKNGIEAMLEIKDYQKEHQLSTPIVALTANAVSGDKEKYLAEGFDDYLAKPIDSQELEVILKKYLG